MVRCVDLLLCAAGALFFTSGFFFADVRPLGTSACADLASADPALAREAVASARALRAAGLLPAGTLRDDGTRHWGDYHAEGLDWRTAEAPERVGASCWLPARFRRAAVVVVDALRYDFVRAVHETRARCFHNRMPRLQAALRRDPRARLYAFEAETPTVTMQRVKGLTTGAPPTYVDVRNNFGAPAEREDSLVAQAARLGRRMIFMGDDTWTMLYPTQFNVARPYDSFNIRDMHTVDDGVGRDLLPALRNQTLGPWELLVAHFLGVDHAGHRFGPAHPAMAAKLEQMDRAVAAVLAAVDNDTVVAVLGDHGMTRSGNHGGAARAETAAALVLFAKRPLWTRELLRGAGCAPRAAAAAMGSDDPTWADTETLWLDRAARSAPQVDFAPTLALLLGLPVPWGSVGRVLGDLATDPALAQLATQRPPAPCADLAAATARQDLLQQLVVAWQLRRRARATAADPALEARYEAARALGLQALAALGRPDAARGHRLRWTYPAGSSQPRAAGLERAAAAVVAVRGYSAAAVAAVRAGVGFRAVDMVRGVILIALTAVRGLLGPERAVAPWAPWAAALVAAAAALGWRLVGPSVVESPLLRILDLALGSVPFAAAAGLGIPLGGVRWPRAPVDYAASALAVGFAAAPLAAPSVLSDPQPVVYGALVAVTLLLALWAVHRGAAWAPTAVAAGLALAAQAAGAAWSEQRLEEPVDAMGPAQFALSTAGPAAACAAVSYRLAAVGRAGARRYAVCTAIAAAAAVVYWTLNRQGLLEPFEASSALLRLGLPRLGYALSLAALVGHCARGELALGALGALPAVALLHGPRAPRTLMAMVLHVAAGDSLVTRSARLAVNPTALWLVLAAWHWFFATGHGPRLADLQTASPYVGFDAFDMARGTVMVFANTFAAVVWILGFGTGLALQRNGLRAARLARRAAGIWALQTAVTMGMAVLGRDGPAVWTELAPRALLDLAALLTAHAVLAATTVVAHACARQTQP